MIIKKMLKTPRLACRVPIFLPTRRTAAAMTMVVKTSWGWGEVTGKLTQQHRDVLDALPASAIRWRVMENGARQLEIDPARLRTQLGWNRVNSRQIRQRLRELLAASVTLVDKNAGRVIEGHLVDEISVGKPIKRPRQRQVSSTVAETWIITISAAWERLTRTAPTSYPVEIVRLRYGSTQALARFVLSHENGMRYHITSIFDSIGVRRRDQAGRQVLSESAALGKMGIVIDGEMVMHQKPAAMQQKPAAMQQKPAKCTKNPQRIDI